MATGTYTHTTLDQLSAQLAEDSSDSGQVFFTAEECKRALIEALRVSNALTARVRYTIPLTTAAGTAWYDLDALAPTVLAPSITDKTAVEDVQYRLMQPVDALTGAGMSDMFSLAEIKRVLSQVRDSHLTTAQYATAQPLITNIPDGGLIPLDESIAAVTRVVWIDELGRRTILRNATDEGMMTARTLDRRSRRSTPLRWSVIGSNQLHLQLDPAPEFQPGSQSLQLWAVNKGPAIDPTANANTGNILGIHDDVASSAVWGALGAIYSKHGMGNDPRRSKLADDLFTLMRAVARGLPSILEVQVRGVDVRVGRVDVLDAKSPGWERETYGVPRRAVAIGDWLGLYPVPDDSIPVTVVVNAKLPALTGTDFVQIPEEHLAGVLAWAKQILLFKVGGSPLDFAAQRAGLLIAQAREFNSARVDTCQYALEYLGIAQPQTPTVMREADQVDISGDPRDTASTRNIRSRSLLYNPPLLQIGGE